MTDKEIIIDGVNVAECEFHSSTPTSELCYMKGNKCNDSPNCYYKQLQRKTQQCEELKKELDTAKINYSNEMDYQRMYYQALEKIESIADDYNRAEKPHQYYRDGFDEIIDIINEVKGE